MNVLGEGRIKEAASYVKEIGIKNVEVKRSGESTEKIVENKIILAKGLVEGKKLDLSVMPLSSLLAASKARRLGPLSWWSRFNGGDNDYQFAIIDLKGKLHFIADIRWANGILVKDLLSVLQSWHVSFESVNLYGIAGSLTSEIGPDTLVVPAGGHVHSLDPEHREPVHITNGIKLPGATLVMNHGNVSSILEETDQAVRELRLSKKVSVVEMEAYHLLQKLESMEYTGTVKIVFKIHDVVTSPKKNISVAVGEKKGWANEIIGFRKRLHFSPDSPFI